MGLRHKLDVLTLVVAVSIVAVVVLWWNSIRQSSSSQEKNDEVRLVVMPLAYDGPIKFDHVAKDLEGNLVEALERRRELSEAVSDASVLYREPARSRSASVDETEASEASLIMLFVLQG